MSIPLWKGLTVGYA